jgi:hypothetical protein
MQNTERTDIPTHNVIPKEGEIKTVLSNIPYVPEVKTIVGRPKDRKPGVVEPLSQDDWTEFLCELSRVKTDRMIATGIAAGYFSQTEVGRVGDAKRERSEVDLESIFPGNVQLVDFFERSVSKIQQGPLGESGTLSPALALAKMYFGKFAQDPVTSSDRVGLPQPVGRLHMQTQFGLPVVVCEKFEDFAKFTPYTWDELKLTSDSQALSFVVTKRSRPYISAESDSEGALKQSYTDTLWVICLETCPRELVEQHIREQLEFKALFSTERATPILISPVFSRQANEKLVRPSIQDALDGRIRETVLKMAATGRISVPALWMSGPARDRRVRAILSELFDETSFLDMREYIKPLSIKLEESEEGIEKEAFARMSQALNVMNKFVNVPFAGAKWWELFVANYLAHFPLSDWESAMASFTAWRGRPKFVRSLGILRRSLKDV